MTFIRKFQTENKLTPDGIIGKNTLSKFKQILNVSNVELAHFMGQCSHESLNFFVLEENLNYSAKRLLEVFPKYFKANNVIEYANKPIKIANRVYANRMNNGNEASGDGWKYRGRGLIQLTGKINYLSFAKYIGDLSIIDNPDLVTSKYALESAKFFFDTNNIWKYCKTIEPQSILNVSRLINIGNLNSKLIPHGLKNRENLTIKFYSLIK